MSVNLEAKLDEAERKAHDSLSRYKFMMFGYWAAVWVHLNEIGGFGKPNPFREYVALARQLKAAQENEDFAAWLEERAQEARYDRAS